MHSPDCSPLRAALRFIAALLAVLLPSAVFAQTATELRLRDQGRMRTFEVASDELLLSRRGSATGEIASEVRSKVEGATIMADFGTKALVKLPKPVDRGRALAGALPAELALAGSEAQPVIYQKGLARGAATRRYVSREVRVQLGGGQTAQDLVARTGAEGTRRTELAGYAILRFSNPWRALEAADRLNQAGTRADVMLERVLERLAAPNDPFFPLQWHLRNTGQGGGTLGVDANVVNAWDITRGAGVTIVVVDDSLQTNHPDLLPNTPAFDSGLHFDFRDGDIDPRPADVDDRHGTAVAGVAAARQNNAVGTSGSGPEARLLGVRLIGSPVSDQDVADALRWEPGNEVASISNNSWGYIGGPGLRGIDLVMQDALRRAATEGRNGLGQVTFFANGNSQQSEDDGNYSTLPNSRYVAAIGALTNFGEQSFYSTPGANVLVSAPSNGGSLGVFTTDVTGNGGYNPTFPAEPADRNYTNSFGGTSSATPLTSGGAALILAANPNLGWRDVHEILAQTARKIDLADPDWADNGAGFHFNHRYGAGMIDLTAAVVRALDWNILAAETTATRNLDAPLVPAAIPDNGTLTRSFDFGGSQNVRVERVEVVARITHGHRSDLDIELVSPAGKRSLLAARHSRPSPQSFDDDIDYDDADGQGWSFTTTHHWGENSQGVWQLNVHDRVTGTSGSLEIARVNIFGTPSEPQRVRFAVQRQSAVENIGSVLLRVERLYGAEGQLAVDLETSTAATGNAAVPGEDYEAIAQRLVFDEGETFKEIPFVVQNDDLIEGNKYAYLTLKNVTGGSLGGNSLMRVDIVDDESNVITVVPGDVDVREKEGTPDVGTFIVARSKATSDPVVVNFTISGTATEGTDYQSIPSTVTIPPDVASVTVTVAPVDDEFLEGTETVIMTIEQDPGYAIGIPATAQLNIIDNDLPLVEIRAVDNTAEEQGLTTGLFRVSRKHPRAGEILALDGPLAVNLEVGGSAQPSQNYVPIEDRTVIEAGSDHVDIVVTPIDDQEYRASQVVVVKIAPSAEYGFGFSTQDAVNIIENEPIPDRSKPTVTILSPPQNAQISSPAVKIDISGTATDNQQVARVTYQVNEGPVRIAGGTTVGLSTPWSAEIVGDVLPGVNILRVQSFDQFDNPSPVVTRTFIYVEPHQLTVAVEAGGKITTEFQGVSTRNAGLEYTIVAQPSSKQFVFAGWSGDLEATGREFTFTMPGDDINLVANFVPNPYTSAVTGRYQGLIHGQPFGFESAGFVDINLTKTGAFSASVTMGGIKYRFKGEFTADQPEPGKARFRGALEQKNSAFPLILDFIVDMSAAGTQRIEGSISPEDAPFNSAVSAEREFFNKSNPYAPAQSKPQTFTMVFPAIENATNVQPHGLGWATMRIDRNGGVKWSGVLPDGTKASQSTFLRKDLTWPIFLELYKKQGVILGSVAVDDQQPDNDLHGQVDWFKADTGDKLFPSKFTVAPLEVIGSIYTPPPKNVRVLPTFDGAGTIECREGFLVASNSNREFSASMTLSAGNQATIAPPNPQLVEVTIAPGTGTFRGSFVHPHTFSITRKRTPFSGVIFQRKQPGAAGQFIGELPTRGTFQTGQVLITPNAPAP